MTEIDKETFMQLVEEGRQLRLKVERAALPRRHPVDYCCDTFRAQAEYKCEQHDGRARGRPLPLPWKSHDRQA